MQSGGWSVRWQGFEGNDFWKGQNKASANASSVLDGLKLLQAKNNVHLSDYHSLHLFIQIIQLLQIRFRFNWKEDNSLINLKI